METIHIFGDSFAMPTYQDFTWTNRLKQEYEVKNHAKGGTGPDWSLNNFINVTNTVEENSYCIFMVSDIYRLNLKFMEPEDSHMVNLLMQPKGTLDLMHYPHIKKYAKFRDFLFNLNKLYLDHSTYWDTEILKIILFIKHYSDRYKKTLIFPVSIKPADEHYKKLSTDKNFYVHHISMLRYDEASRQQKNPYLDDRPNHMVESEHSEFYNIIINLLKSD